MLGTFETRRLSLRSMALDDVGLLVELDSDPEVMQFLTGRPSTREELEEIVRQRLGCRWIAFGRATGDFVGWFGLVPVEDKVYDLGYRLARRWWGRGLATEGAQALIDVAFSTLGAERVMAQTMAVNQPSRAVMERCGMRYVRTFHLEWDIPLPGTEKGEVEYGLTRDLWRRDRP